LILDFGAQIFHVLDGTGTDAVGVSGHVHVGGAQPLVLVDPIPGAPALAGLKDQLADCGTRDLARILRYDEAVDDRPLEPVDVREILVTPFWTPSFCATVIRAAEAAGAWVNSDGRVTSRSETSILGISSRLLAAADADLRSRVAPRLGGRWPQMAEVGLQDAIVMRYDTGEASGALTPDQGGTRVTGWIRLNDGYGGGSLFFPSQAWNDGRAAVGFLTLWPSAGTHPHRAEAVTRGIKYGLTMRWRNSSA
jgi:hypothetical protein